MFPCSPYTAAKCERQVKPVRRLVGSQKNAQAFSALNAFKGRTYSPAKETHRLLIAVCWTTAALLLLLGIDGAVDAVSDALCGLPLLLQICTAHCGVASIKGCCQFACIGQLARHAKRRQTM